MANQRSIVTKLLNNKENEEDGYVCCRNLKNIWYQDESEDYFKSFQIVRFGDWAVIKSSFPKYTDF